MADQPAQTIHAHPYSNPDLIVPIDWDGESDEQPDDDEYAEMMAEWGKINCKLGPPTSPTQAKGQAPA